MRTALLVLLLVPLALAGCDATGDAAEPPDALATQLAQADKSVQQDLLAARRATVPFYSVARAEAAGWVVGSPCVASPAGGMGYHYVNGALMDGALDPAAPEAVLYEPQADGSLRLVAVEYIVPYGVVPPEGPAPELFGETFHRNDFLGFWALHAWIWRHNPAGLFEDFNPTVSCEYATES